MTNNKDWFGDITNQQISNFIKKSINSFDKNSGNHGVFHNTQLAPQIDLIYKMIKMNKDIELANTLKNQRKIIIGLTILNIIIAIIGAGIIKFQNPLFVF